MRVNARRALDDTDHDRLRSRSGLMWVVVGYFVASVLLVALWLLFGAIGGVTGIAVWVVALIAIRLAVRSQADLPDEVLDERMRGERDRAYLTAYRTVAGIVIVAAIVALIAVGAAGLDDAPATLTLNENEVNALFWGLLALMIGAPSTALALEQRRRNAT